MVCKAAVSYQPSGLVVSRVIKPMSTTAATFSCPAGSWSLRSYPYPVSLDDLSDYVARGPILIEGAEKRRGSLARHGDQQAAARLRVVERQEVFRLDSICGYAAFEVLTVALEPAGIAAVGCQGHSPFPYRYLAPTHHRSDPGAFDHLREVSEEAVARDVCCGRDPDVAQGVAGTPVQVGDHLDGVFDLGLRDEISLQGGGEDTEAKRLCEHQCVPYASAGVSHDPVLFDPPCDGETVLRLFVLHGVAAAEPGAGFLDPGLPAGQDLPQDAEVQGAGKCDQVQRGQRFAAHRVDIGEGVGRGDLAEPVRVVHDRGEEVSRLKEQAAAERDVPGVVPGLHPAHEPVHGGRGEALQSLLQVPWSELRRSTRLGRVLRQPYARTLVHRLQSILPRHPGESVMR